MGAGRNVSLFTAVLPDRIAKPGQVGVSPSGSSSAGELHPCALTEPYVKLSFHTALLAPDRTYCPM